MIRPTFTTTGTLRTAARTLAAIAIACLAGSAWADDAVIPQIVADPGDKVITRDPSAIAKLEIRDRATVAGTEVRLKHVCVWPAADDAMFASLADLVLVRIDPAASFTTITHEQIRTILHDAGVNQAVINFAGATVCTIDRVDNPFNEAEALDAWARGAENIVPVNSEKTQAVILADAVTQQQQRLHPATTQPSALVVTDTRSLQSVLTEDIATRLNLPAAALQVDFRAEDRGLLSLTSLQVKFDIEPHRTAELGEWRWVVSITSGVTTRKVQIIAQVRAWQEQVVVKNLVAFKNTIRAEDVEVRRALVDRIGDGAAPLDAVVGSAAVRELKPGMVITPRLIAPVELARSGQLITVIMRRGGVEIRTVATAMEAGSYGQTIRVKNNATRQPFDVVLVGPQTAVLGDTVQGAKPDANKDADASASVKE
jgi:flagella basal body P-ring formation protein FlgA